MKLSAVFGGQFIGIREVADRIWLISFMEYDPGFFDEDENRVEPEFRGQYRMALS